MTFIGTDFGKKYYWTIGGVLSLLTGTSVYYLSSDQLSIGDYILILASLAVAIVSLIIIVPLKRDYDKGLPVVDEHSRISGYKSGYYTWLVTIWIVVVIMLFEDLIVRVFVLTELTIEQFAGTVVFSSILTFFGLSQYFVRRGKVN
jgi:membrane protease YdiL (CAAX protease family)